MIDKERELLDLIRMRRDSLTLDGRDGQGVTPTAPEQSTTWIVTQVEPVLMAQPLTGGPAVSIQATDAIKGVRVANRIRVEVRGMGSRVAVALLDPLPISQRDQGETVATVNGRDLDVGGSVTLDASDVGALPAGTTLEDLGYTDPTVSIPPHSHSVDFSATAPVNLTLNLPYLGYFDPMSTTPPSAYDWQWAYDVVRRINFLLGAIDALDERQLSGSTTVNVSGSTGTSSAGGGTWDGDGGSSGPTTPAERSVVVNVSKPVWFEPGSPDVWSWSWGSDVLTLIRRAADTLNALSGRTLPVTGGEGSITLRTTSAPTWEPPPWEAYGTDWADNIQNMLGGLYAAYGTIRGSYSVPGGGSITLGSAISNPAVTPPGQYTQAYGASVRLSLNRLFGQLNAIAGASFPVN